MRYLILTRGIPGSGKSTFLKQKGLEPYTISPDQIRLLWSTPIQTTTGQIMIDPQNDKKVWEFLFQRLDERMSKGEFIIIDATHTSKESISSYKSYTEKYRYQTVCIDFADIDIDLALQRNEERE